jgi:cytidine deaminase
MSEMEKLKKGIDLAISSEKNVSFRTSSIAYSKSGKSYLGGSVSSGTHLLDIVSEQVSLSLATQRNDFNIEEVVTLIQSDLNISPITSKILIDFEARVGKTIKYRVVNLKGEIIWQTDSLESMLPLYKPTENKISKINQSIPSDNFVESDGSDEQLVKCAIDGMSRNFPSSDNSSGYGSAFLTDKGNVYFGGQYSSTDKRLNLHAETATMLNVLFSEKNEKPVKISVVSEKYKTNPCFPCGACLQLISELFSPDLQIISVSSQSMEYVVNKLSNLLPNRWSNDNLV